MFHGTQCSSESDQPSEPARSSTPRRSWAQLPETFQRSPRAPIPAKFRSLPSLSDLLRRWCDAASSRRQHRRQRARRVAARQLERLWEGRRHEHQNLLAAEAAVLAATVAADRQQHRLQHLDGRSSQVKRRSIVFMTRPRRQSLRCAGVQAAHAM